MLKKNVYIIFPPGYSGSYVQWSLNISDNDQFLSTIKDPINTVPSDKFGGTGTAHLNVKIPTHQGPTRHLTWIALNKPTEPLMFPIDINPFHGNNVQAVFDMMQIDRDGIFINIHDDDDFLVQSYGAINCTLKWPTFLEVNGVLYNEIYKINPKFDPYNCKDDRIFRNMVALKNRYLFFTNSKIDYTILYKGIKLTKKWYNVRNNRQPHEVNENYYVTNYDTTNRIFDLSCTDIVSDKFPDILKNILERSNLSDSYNIDYLKLNHHKYIECQPNLQWFISFKNWIESKKLDEYLTSHAVIEGRLIMYMLSNAPEKIQGWENLDINTINQMYFS